MSIDKLIEAQEALQRGERMHARKLARQVLLADPRNEQAWLMMARLVDTQQQVVDCLEHVLTINPQNVSASRALKAIRREHPVQVQPQAPGPQIASLQPAAVIKREVPAITPVSLPSVKETTIQPPRRKINWSLLFGTAIVLFVVLIALIGPLVAPKDPMEEHAILQVGDSWAIPPFNAFQVPGYILGSDQFGRDMLSRILWAVRPTLIMVSMVAIVRLFLGTLIGLGAGWSNGRVGRFLDTLISAALAIPILMVALGAIAMLGAELGLLAFIVGLSINGWGETARIVREQTQAIKGQLYIEAAHAMGASTFSILTQHILRQVMPMVWMLFAFEISGTLTVTAGLGFLGYFIGGDVWIEVADFVSRRTSGVPELGQMLATSWISLLQPWPLVLTGSVIFTTVLGFNLLGNGLRARLNPEFINRNSPLDLLSRQLQMGFEQYVSYPVSNWFRANRLRPALVIALVIALAGSLYLYQTRVASQFNPSQAALGVPGGQLWASERTDPYGTKYTNSIGPVDPHTLWVVNHAVGFSGSPAISADGTIYVAGLDAILIALNPDGTKHWDARLPVVPLGPLALGPQGIIYVTDANGGLSAFSPDGHQLWTYTTQATGRPTHGAIVAPNGTIYYLLEDPRGDTLVALLPDGTLLWSVKPGTNGDDVALRLTPDGQEIFVKNVVVNAADGTIVDLTLPTQGSPVLAGREQLLVGADGRTYLLGGHVVMQWTQTSRGFNLVKSADWNYRGAGFNQNSGLPVDAGVTAKGDIWLFYSGFYGGTAVYWLDPTGKILGNSASSFYEGTRLVAVDGNGNAIICGIAATDQGFATVMCEAYPTVGTEPVWSYILGVEIGGVVGAALAPDRLYVITSNGDLTALGQDSITSPTPTVAP